MLANNGVVIARDLYVNVLVSGPGENSEWELETPQPGFGATQSPNRWHIVAQDGFNLAPSACVCGVSLQLYLRPPFTGDLRYEITFGCSGAPVQMIRRVVPRAEIEEAHDRFLKTDRNGKAGLEMARAVFGIDDENTVQHSEE